MSGDCVTAEISVPHRRHAGCGLAGEVWRLAGKYPKVSIGMVTYAFRMALKVEVGRCLWNILNAEPLFF